MTYLAAAYYVGGARDHRGRRDPCPQQNVGRLKMKTRPPEVIAELRAAGIKDRILARVLENESGCLEWQGATDKDGYGQISSGGKMHKVHRAMCPDFPTEDKPYALHACDNPKCCNPSHLSWGSDSRNKKEKRDRLGNSTSQKLTRDQAYVIKYLDLRSYAEVARDYGVTRHAVRRIRTGRNWSDLKLGDDQ